MLSQVSRRAFSRASNQTRKWVHSAADTSVVDPPKQNFIAKALSNLTLSTNMPSVPLNVPFISGSPKNPEPRPVTPASVTTLSNGLRVVSVENNSPVTALGVCVDAGSRYEEDYNAGASYIIENLAFKSTAKSGARTLIRETSRRAANISCTATRDHIVYVGEAMRDHSPYLAKTLHDIVFDPAHMPWEIEEVVHRCEQSLNSNSPPDVIDALHNAGFNGTTLGRSLLPTLQSLHSFGPDLLESFRKRFFTPNRTVVAAVGIEHGRLVELADKFYGGLSRGSDEVVPYAARYVGGEVRHQTSDDLVTYGISFEAPHWQHPLVIPLTVLQTLLGGGGSFSSGGPGKGMHSRLYLSLLNQNDWLVHVQSFHAVYNDSGLFGIYGTAPANYGAQLASEIAGALRKVAAESVTSEELARAKNLLKTALFLHLDNRAVNIEDMSRQLTTYGKVHSGSEVCAMIDKVTQDDIKKAAAECLRKAPSVAAIGNTRSVPRYDEVVRMFK